MFDSSDFKHCPLCGDKIFIEILLGPTTEYFEVSCDCGLSFKGSDLDDLYSWNTRASETPNRERIIELVEELSDLVGGGIDE